MRICVRSLMLAALSSLSVLGWFGQPQDQQPKERETLDERKGEDLEEGINVSPQLQSLSRIADLMSGVAQSLDRASTSQQVQQQQMSILAELDRMIEADRQQSQQQGSRSGAQNDENQDQESGNESVTESPSDGTIGENQTDGGALGAESNMEPFLFSEETWGHLPPRVREAMRAVGNERFLPRYQKLIEAYYKRLANVPDGRP